MRPQLSRRNATTGGLAVTTAASTGAGATASQDEWPEFRKWYALTLEEEAIYNETPKPDARDARLKRIGEARDLLEAVMLANSPRSLTDLAVLGVIALYWSDSFGSAGGRVRCLDLSAIEGGMTGCRKDQSDTILIAATVRLALGAGLLPGIAIHGV